MCKDNGQDPFIGSRLSCTTVANDNYTGSKLKFGKKIPKVSPSLL